MKKFVSRLLWVLKRLSQPVKKQMPAELTYLYTDRQGFRYYTYQDPLQMPIRRMIAIESASRFLEMNLTRESLQAMLVLMEQAANRGQIVALFHYIQELKTRLELVGEEDCLLQLAGCYFIREDENPQETHLIPEKIACWKQDPEALHFFLNACIRSATGCGNDLSADSPNYSDKDFKQFKDYRETFQPLITELNRLSSKNTSAN